MPADSNILEQVVPASATPTDLYTVPDDRRASVRIYVAAITAAVVKLQVRKAGAATDPMQYLAHADSIGANGTQTVPSNGYPLLLSAGDVVTVESDQADTTFQANGYEDDQPV